MSREVRYADAVRLLGGESGAAKALDTVLGGGLLVGSVFNPALLALFDPKADFVGVGRELVGRARGLVKGKDRRSRTELLEAAHTIVVVTAFFEAFAGLDLPFDHRKLELTREEQTTLGARAASGPWDAFPWKGIPGCPRPGLPYERARAELLAYYTRFTNELEAFVSGLAVVARMPESDRDQLRAAARMLPAEALKAYEDGYRRLAGDVPEFAFWSEMVDHQATRAELSVGMSRLEELLTEVSSGRVPEDRMRSIAGANRALLDRPVAQSGDVPEGMVMPSLAEAYIHPRFRVAEVGTAGDPSSEQWWSGVAVRDEVQEFLFGHLTSSAALRAPLVVLGQPGSGKSVLTRALAARLPASDFLPIRVPLRDVPADGSVQDQIEHGIRATTGERVDWPDLVRSAGGALPLVLLDGFDELLQATGVRRSDYLTAIADFQRREAELGRPVAVVVTSRTAVADRCAFPAGTMAVRLEPFAPEQVRQWLAVWNAANAGFFAARSLEPLELDDVLAQPQLAEQPLLLLMLALYDADGNALRKASEGLSRAELYERLLDRFARREVAKHHPGAELDELVERELLRLSVVAFAMFNRGRQWVTAEELNADLAVLCPADRAEPVGMRAPLTDAEVVIGRFFFVHRAEATRDAGVLRTFEFLHATFGEYLIARLIAVELDELLARRSSARRASLGRTGTDDDLLHALLSFAVLATRGPILDFLSELVRESERGRLTGLLIDLLRGVDARTAPGYPQYRPASTTMVALYATYSANLLLMAVRVSPGGLHAGDLFGGEDDAAVASWRRLALLWQSQCSPEEWESLVQAVDVQRVWRGRTRDLKLSAGNHYITPFHSQDLYWTYDVPPGDERRDSWLLPKDPLTIIGHAQFICSPETDLLAHLSEPIMRSRIGQDLIALAPQEVGIQTVTQGLLTLMVSRPDEHLVRAYEQYLRTFSPQLIHTSRLLPTYLAMLTADAPRIPVERLTGILSMLWKQQLLDDIPELVDDLATCLIAALGRGAAEDENLARFWFRRSSILRNGCRGDLRVWLALAERSVLPVSDRRFRPARASLALAASTDPDLVYRALSIAKEREIWDLASVLSSLLATDDR
ncbi:NACHT domain-containing protein [Sphaerisporangium fuscum]|uniref:NACHT domain-containing protein n=1 Tax=Sphaerisporangium fuscum TaxID=2835868 RepID=UPI001BDC2918|nr:hypothetical protein [Sphaerisporangium fuscum]